MTTIDPQNELAFIRKMMEESQQSLCNNWRPSIGWGTVVALGLGLTYASIGWEVPNVAYSIGWIGISLGAFLYTFLSARKLKRSAAPRTFAGRMQGAVWAGAGIAIATLTIMVFLVPWLGGAHIPAIYICPISALILGAACFASGTINGMSWLRYVAVGWWIGGAAMFYVNSIEVLLVEALLLMALQVVPGVMMQRSDRARVSSIA